MVRPPPRVSSNNAADKDDDMFQCITDRAWQRFGAPDRGQDLIEYALLVALIVIVVMAAVQPLGTTIKTVFWDVIATSTNL